MNHAQHRAVERYGLELRRSDFDAIREQVRAGLTMLLSRSEQAGHMIERHVVECQGLALIVALCENCGKIVTVLPKGPKPRGFYDRKVTRARRKKHARRK